MSWMMLIERKLWDLLYNTSNDWIKWLQRRIIYYLYLNIDQRQPLRNLSFLTLITYASYCILKHSNIYYRANMNSKKWTNLCGIVHSKDALYPLVHVSYCSLVSIFKLSNNETLLVRILWLLRWNVYILMLTVQEHSSTRSYLRAAYLHQRKLVF